MLQSLKNREYIQKLLNAESCDRVHDLWWDKPDGLFIKCVDTIFEDAVGDSTNTHKRYIYECVDGKYYEYSYWEDYFGETDCYRFREVVRQPVVVYEWE
nr:MAG TPA: hypothetical protein [Caudoviricetes sp.]